MYRLTTRMISFWDRPGPVVTFGLSGAYSSLIVRQSSTLSHGASCYDALMSSNDLLTVEEAAARFGVHRTTLFRWIKENKLAVQKGKLGDRRTYVRRTAVEELLGPAVINVTRCLELVYQRFTATGDWPLAM